MQDEALGQVSGNALNWRYTLLQFDDWMFLAGDGVMIIRAEFSKFGIRLGELLLSFQRLSG